MLWLNVDQGADVPTIVKRVEVRVITCSVLCQRTKFAASETDKENGSIESLRARAQQDVAYVISAARGFKVASVIPKLILKAQNSLATASLCRMFLLLKGFDEQSRRAAFRSLLDQSMESLAIKSLWIDKVRLCSPIFALLDGWSKTGLNSAISRLGMSGKNTIKQSPTAQSPKSLK